MMGAAGAGEKIYVEDVFSTYLYTGNGSTQTITNGIDLAGKGGLLWMKTRARATGDLYARHFLYDSARGLSTTSYLHTNSTDAQGASGSVGSSPTFLSNGFTPGPSNQNTETYASWTFRKAAKFFDVVTYTGNGTARTIAHNLGSVPGCIIVKSTSQADNWKVYHRSLTSNAYYILLDSTAAQSNAVDHWNNTTPTSTEFSIGSSSNINTNGATYVAYLFAHDAGGFGDSGNDNVISCGSYTGNGSTNGPTITLGWEPQWLLIKRTDSAGYSWFMHDNMRQMSLTNTAYLIPDSSSAESLWGSALFNPTATGFQLNTSIPSFNGSGGTYIYIAIRRGPMKTPTDATKVLTLQARTGDSTENTINTEFPPDFWFTKSRSVGGVDYRWVSGNRLVGLGRHLSFNLTDAELNYGTPKQGSNQNEVLYGDFGVSRLRLDETGTTYVDAWFRRAPGFFDVVGYAGNGSDNRQISHNLGAIPELMIVKQRSSTAFWAVYAAALGNTKYLNLSTTDAEATSTAVWSSATPTSTYFEVDGVGAVNQNTQTYIAYLFVSCPGVSKVGSYTGTGTTQQINCGFTNGARFVLIKRTDSTGDWYVWDTARGIVSGNDPYLLLNSTAAEVTNTDYIDTFSSGFEISSIAPAAINANGGSYIFLAIA